MDTVLVLAYGILGAVTGSFLNVCIDRLPAGQSLMMPPSHCPSCGYRLKPRDLIPIISYLWLRGRCRMCRAPIPWRVLFTECLSAALFAFLMWRFNGSLYLAVTTLYTCLLITIAVIDFEHGLILDRLTYPGIVAGLVISFFLPEVGIYRALLGGFVGLGLIVLIIVAFRGGMGLGDAKMAAMLGTMLGFPTVFLGLLIAVVTGGIAAAVLLALKLKGRKDTVPFGPFLAVGGWVALVYGQELFALFIIAR
ncbi:MAG: prepilin peptidase [Dehalococcoidia bacterium]|nr:prepilin peptidase [Dehalococcoidia bacterium]